MTVQDSQSELFRQKIVDLGFLSPDRALEALADFYQREGEGKAPQDFPSYLYRQGWLNKEQLERLGVPIPRGSTTMVSASRVGTVHSGCLIEKKLGHGGMGTVYLARRESDGAQVVVKFLAADKLMRPTTRRRFAREAEILGKVKGLRNVVSVLAVSGEDDEEPHIVMELVDGPSLHQVLEDRFSLPWTEAIPLARDAALGLVEIHALGIVHRDIKPANLLLSAQGGVKIVDFGLAKDMELSGITQPGQVLGTPTYMAPEQWVDVEVDARVDLFSLGATLYHMVVGEPPFEGRRNQEVAQKILRGEYTPPERIVAGLPPDLELVIAQLLHTDRRWRYASAKQVAEDLQRILDRQPVEVPHLHEPRRDRRHPLVRGTRWLVGREETCDIVIPDASVSRQHAEVLREPGGFVLRDLGSSYGTFQGGQKVERARLTPGDAVRLGKVELSFVAPGLPTPPAPPAPTPSPEEAKPAGRESGETTRASPLRLLESSRGWRLRAERAVSDAVFEALSARNDPRTAVALLERLAPGLMEERVASVLPWLQLDEEQTSRVRTRIEERSATARRKAEERLAAIAAAAPPETSDVEGWLIWYDRMNGSLPAQLVPLRPRPGARLRAVEGEPAEIVRSVGAAMREAAIGRGENCQVRLEHRSVSRLHATVLRWNDRLVLRDEGSRFGSELNGSPIRIAFLDPGDVVTLGKVKLACEREPAPRQTQRGPLGAARVDPELFESLIELRHPSVATGLALILHEAARPERVEAEARRFAPQNDAHGFLAAVMEAWRLRAEAARALLPVFLGAEAQETAGWRQLLAEKRAGLPPQVAPWGWPGG